MSTKALFVIYSRWERLLNALNLNVNWSLCPILNIAICYLKEKLTVCFFLPDFVCNGKTPCESDLAVRAWIIGMNCTCFHWIHKYQKSIFSFWTLTNSEHSSSGCPGPAVCHHILGKKLAISWRIPQVHGRVLIPGSGNSGRSGRLQEGAPPT